MAEERPENSIQEPTVPSGDSLESIVGNVPPPGNIPPGAIGREIRIIETFIFPGQQEQGHVAGGSSRDANTANPQRKERISVLRTILHPGSSEKSSMGNLGAPGRHPASNHRHRYEPYPQRPGLRGASQLGRYQSEMGTRSMPAKIPTIGDATADIRQLAISRSRFSATPQEVMAEDETAPPKSKSQSKQNVDSSTLLQDSMTPEREVEASEIQGTIEKEDRGPCHTVSPVESLSQEVSGVFPDSEDTPKTDCDVLVRTDTSTAGMEQSRWAFDEILTLVKGRMEGKTTEQISHDLPTRTALACEGQSKRLFSSKKISGSRGKINIHDQKLAESIPGAQYTPWLGSHRKASVVWSLAEERKVIQCVVKGKSVTEMSQSLANRTPGAVKVKLLEMRISQRISGSHSAGYWKNWKVHDQALAEGIAGVQCIPWVAPIVESSSNASENKTSETVGGGGADGSATGVRDTQNKKRVPGGATPHWPIKDERMLTKLSIEGKSIEEISDHLGRTHCACRRRRYLLQVAKRISGSVGDSWKVHDPELVVGLTGMEVIPWVPPSAENQLDALDEEGSEMYASEQDQAAVAVPDANPKNADQKPPRKGPRWDLDEDTTLMRLSIEGKSLQEIADEIGRTYPACRNERCGLKNQKRISGSERRGWCIHDPKLIAGIPGVKLTPWVAPGTESSPSALEEEGSNTNKRGQVDLRSPREGYRWTLEEDTTLVRLILERKSRTDIADGVGRLFDSCRNRCHTLKAKKRISGSVYEGWKIHDPKLAAGIPGAQWTPWVDPRDESMVEDVDVAMDDGNEEDEEDVMETEGGDVMDVTQGKHDGAEQPHSADQSYDYLDDVEMDEDIIPTEENQRDD